MRRFGGALWLMYAHLSLTARCSSTNSGLGDLKEDPTSHPLNESNHRTDYLSAIEASECNQGGSACSPVGGPERAGANECDPRWNSRLTGRDCYEVPEGRAGPSAVAEDVPCHRTKRRPTLPYMPGAATRAPRHLAEAKYGSDEAAPR